MPTLHPWSKQRSGRLEYFTMLLLIWLGGPIALVFTFALMGGLTGGSTATPDAVWGLYWLAAFTASFCVAIRRNHDMGYSGWRTFLVCIPLAGLIFHAHLLFQVGTQGPNEYGPVPPKRVLWFPVGTRIADEVVPQCPIA